MKFGYSYKTSDGVRHESVYHAPTREDVFAGLREKGIRPIKVWEMEQTKRPASSNAFMWGVIALLGLALVGVIVYLLTSVSYEPPEPKSEDRSQIYGDPGIIQTCEAKGWRNVFPDPADRFLARFAQPGVKVSLAGTVWRKNVVEALKANLRPVRIADGDCPEVAKMKRMVNGMKLELRQYLKDGGSVEEYVGEVLERQSVEEKILESFKAEMEKLERSVTKDNLDETVNAWNAKNATLRQMGLRTIPIPDRIGTMGL